MHIAPAQASRIADISRRYHVRSLYDAQALLHRVINPKVFAPDEWRGKLAQQAPFELDVLSKPKIFVIGKQDDLDQFGESGQQASLKSPSFT